MTTERTNPLWMEAIVHFRKMLATFLRRLGLMKLIAPLHQTYLNLIKWICRLTGRSHMDVIYNEGYFAAEEEWTEPSAQEVVQIIIDALHPDSVVDVGCGSAVYLRFFKQAGLDIRGYDGSPAALRRAQVEQSLLRHCDLTKPLQADRAFDLAICFEVAEHLPHEASPVIVRSLIGLAPCVLFSAAQPGQGGVDHINEQPCAFWVEQFHAAGYRQDEAMTAQLRAAMGRQGSVWWLEKNLMVFRQPAGGR